MGTGYAPENMKTPAPYAQQNIVIPAAPPEPLEGRLQHHADRLGVALRIANNMLQPGAEGPATPEPVGANGWMMQSQGLVEELITSLERLQEQIGRL